MALCALFHFAFFSISISYWIKITYYIQFCFLMGSACPMYTKELQGLGQDKTPIYQNLALVGWHAKTSIAAKMQPKQGRGAGVCALGCSTMSCVSLHLWAGISGESHALEVSEQPSLQSQCCLQRFRSASGSVCSSVLPHWLSRASPAAGSFPSETVRADRVDFVVRPSGH